MNGHSVLLNSFPLPYSQSFPIHIHNTIYSHFIHWNLSQTHWADIEVHFVPQSDNFFTSNISHAFNERRESSQQWEWDWKKRFFLMKIIDKEPTNRVTSKPTYLLNAIARSLKCVYFIMIILQSFLRKKET